MKHSAANVDDYIAGFPAKVQAYLQDLRAAVRAAAPQAEEGISYGMPAYKLNGVLVYFAAHKNHIGFYPTGSTMKVFQDEFTDYKTSKGTVQFPFDQPLPLDLVDKIVRFRVRENTSQAKK